MLLSGECVSGFLELVELIVYDRGFCKDGETITLMTNNKLCMFVINTAELCRKDRDFYAVIIENRREINESSIAVSRIDASRIRPDVHRFHIEPQSGDLVVAHFNRAPVSNNYEYEFVPVEMSTINCSKDLTSQRKYSSTKFRVEINDPSPDQVITVNREKAQRRTFDLNGQAAHCPLRESQETNEFVGHLVNDTRPENEQSPNDLSDNREIVDDVNLFVINVVLVDPI
ncbi:hypothetical protein AGLY_009018 [Aphis glycines]|uniref:Uncharacterized protein n=1 Tax=Aphis glycines TaxID=307491 RepID=A0A6G0TL17_APHGL|nr:hypothetical protein AGLY_009018 [Aphis glycines]